MRSSRSCILALVLAVAPACGDAGTGGSEGSDATSAGTGDSASTTSSSAASETDVSTSGIGCGLYLDEEEVGPPVEFEITNTRAAPVYLHPGDGCTVLPNLALTRGGQPVAFLTPGCTFTCEDYMAGDCLCADDCVNPPTIRVDPGGVYRYTWSGGVYESFDEPPAVCFPEPCTGSCAAQRSAGVGSYQLRTTAGTDVPKCVDEPTACDCAPTADGWCELFNVYPQDIAGEPLTAIGDFALPGAGTVLVEF